MTLADYTDKNLIVPQLKAADMRGSIEELSCVLQQEHRIPEKTPFCQAALKREMLSSTALENGMALPHARLPNLPGISFAVGRARDGVDWGPNSPNKVRLVFLLGVPLSDAAAYLYVLYGLARLGKESDLLKKVFAAETAAAILEVFNLVRLRKNAPALV